MTLVRFHLRRLLRQPPSRLGLLSLFVLLLSSALAYSQEKYEISVEPVFGRVYPPDRMLALRVVFQNHTDSPVDGQAIIPSTEGVAPAEFRVPATVPAHSRVAIVAYGYLPDKTIPKESGAHAVPVTIVEWRDVRGARLARSELLAQPENAGKEQGNISSTIRGFLILSVRDSQASETSDAYLPKGLASLLDGQLPYPINVGECEPQALPRHSAGYGAVRAVVFNSSPDALDACQRKALVDFVVGGGDLILSAPLDAADPSAAWLRKYCPVKVVGSREVSEISASKLASFDPASAETSLKLSEPVTIAEAVGLDGADVLLEDAHYVHAAVRRVGLGRVVFTSFPIDALVHSDPRVVMLWTALLGLDGPSHDWTSSALCQRQREILAGLIGAPASPWSHAALAVSVCILLVLLFHFIWRGARRPLAFAVITVFSLAACASLLGLASLRRSDVPGLSMARVGTIELGPAGGGARNEAIAMIGPNLPDLTLDAPLGASLRPATDTATSVAVIDQLPFQAPLEVHAGRFEQIWRLNDTVSADVKLGAQIQFTAQGIRVTVDNNSGQAITSPVLIWDRWCYRLPDLPIGRASFMLGKANSKGDYASGGVVADEESSIRAQIVQSLRSQRTDMAGSFHLQVPPAICGWISSGGGDVAAPIGRLSASPKLVRSLVLITAPLSVTPAQPGETFHLPAEFVTTLGDAGHGVLFDRAAGEWMQSMLVGPSLIGFEIPRMIGDAVPVRARIAANLAAGRHSLELRRGQCKDGVVRDNPDGPVVVRWNKATGEKTVECEVGPEDVDSRGCFWLRLNVEPAGEGSPDQLQWKINQLAVEFDLSSKPEHH